MSAVFTHFLRVSPNTQRRNVLALVLVLCLWMVASAAHIHIGDAHGAPGKPSTACSTCVSLPTGATPPARHELPVQAQVVSATLVDRAAPSITFHAPSSYLSRAPPTP